jgi:hypothetical protein
MSSEAAGKIIERWGFPVLVALATGWILRNDVLLPLVDEHRIFVRQLGETQKEISTAITEQTRLLHQLVPSRLDEIGRRD